MKQTVCHYDIGYSKKFLR